MANRTLELTLISAKDLNNVNSFTKMDVYAIATIAGDHRTQQRTPVNYDGGKNPSWNSTLRFLLPSDLAAGSRIVVHVLLRSQRTLGDRDVGEVHIPLKELLEGLKEGGPKFVSYQVRKPGSGKAKGVLNISYKFLDSPAAPLPPPAGKPAEAVTAYPPPAKQNEPVMAYPAAGPSGSGYPPPYPPPQGGYAPYPPVPQAGYGYGAPPQAGYGYGAPPQAGYGYGAPPQAGYGYGAPPPTAYGYGAVPAKNNKNNFGLGLGAGLLGGALGGMLIGDMVSDSAAYDSGYDAGFDDGFGF